MKKLFLILSLLLLSAAPLFARGSAQAILVDPYFHLGYTSPADVNDKITLNPGGIQTWVPDAGPIHWGKNFGAFLGYRFKHRFNVGLLFDYTSMGTFISREDAAGFNIYHPSSVTEIPAKYYEYNTSMSAFAIGPAFYYTVYDGGKLTLDLGLGILYALKVHYAEDVTYTNSALMSSDPALNSAPNLVQTTGNGKAFGFQLALSTAYYFTNYLGASFDLGYRYLKCNSLTDAAGNPVYFTYNNGTNDLPNPLNMTIDFSGFYFGLGLRVEFDFGGSGAPAPEKATAADNSWKENKAVTPAELNTSWEEAAVPAEPAPSIDELRTLKKQVQRKYNEVKTSGAPGASKKAERYRKLYDINTKVEKDWDKLSPAAKRDKIEKIKLILSK